MSDHKHSVDCSCWTPTNVRLNRMERAASTDPKVQAEYAAETRREAEAVMRARVLRVTRERLDRIDAQDGPPAGLRALIERWRKS